MFNFLIPNSFSTAYFRGCAAVAGCHRAIIGAFTETSELFEVTNISEVFASGVPLYSYVHLVEGSLQKSLQHLMKDAANFISQVIEMHCVYKACMYVDCSFNALLINL